MPIYEEIDDVLTDPSTSHWLKQALQSALKRDCLNVAEDAQTLALLLSDRATDITSTLTVKNRLSETHCRVY